MIYKNLTNPDQFFRSYKREYTGKLDEELNQYFIYQSSNRMQDLVKGLMDYSRIGKVKELATIDCSKVLNEVLSDMSMIIGEKCP
jgi:light-regulated signal transduction histidine kinase (bacteriophytochrome)